MESNDDLTKYGNYVYASFPVDVVVYFHMQPSTFRFSSLPVSRVECMLQLPSLDIVFSSKRAEDELLHRLVYLFVYEFKVCVDNSKCVAAALGKRKIIRVCFGARFGLHELSGEGLG